ncbi:uncharacterized protein CIMG_08736 [Coccidioides immitis RS]|uniref:Uncharacterized protein n=1 Tax=Coccidioides immitis (strain RS) TaxID=246410 RepID=A0A0E1RVJ4_COCIM|nr:uncharacterized protein CIMG_08736 [Coccidioides immitis RS]EAS29990.1 hypothetical protein CIMG_08736 [Coccidioides immitis RS]
MARSSIRRQRKVDRRRFRNKDPKKKEKADRERYRRQKESLFIRANQLFLDGTEIGHNRYVYVCIKDCKGTGPGKYHTYSSHWTSSWPPHRQDVEQHFPLTQFYSPEDFESDEPNEKAGKSPEPNQHLRPRQKRFKISTPPSLDLNAIIDESSSCGA